jgi:hypothetical protein
LPSSVLSFWPLPSLAAGVDSAQLSRFMRGKRTLTLPIAEKVCEVLQLDLVRRGEAPAKGKRRK